MAVQYLRIQVRRDSSANWAQANPVLLVGEVGFETDTKRSKTGDGVLTWSNLAYDKAGIVSVDETSGLDVDENGVLSLDYDHSDDLGDLGGQTVKAYVDAQDQATKDAANGYADGGDSALQAEINIIKGDANTVGSFAYADAAEYTARTNADNMLDGKIGANTVAINAEKARAEAAEALLTTQVGGAQGDAASAGLAASAAQTTANVALSKADGNITDIAALQADVDQNEADADAAIAALQADVDQNEADADAAIAAVQADVDQNEADADAAIAAVQADVDQNEADADAAIIAVQADVDQNEADANAAITAEETRALAAEAAIEADVATNATDIADNATAIGTKASNDVGTGYAFITDNVSVNVALSQLDTGVAGKANVAVGSDGEAAAYTSTSSLQVAISAIDSALKADVDKMVAVRTAAQAITDSPTGSAEAEIAALQTLVNDILDVLKNATI